MESTIRIKAKINQPLWQVKYKPADNAAQAILVKCFNDKPP